MALRRSGLNCKVELAEAAVLGSFDTSELKRLLRTSHYAFQPITVVLHPPTTCVKTFNLVGSPVSQSLTEHLHEVFPPGDRREMRLMHTACCQDQLLAATINGGVLNNISQTIWRAGGSIRAIVPAAIDLSAKSIRNNESLISEWTLVRYKYERSNAILSIWPSCITPQETRESGTTINRLRSGDHFAQQLDFLPQLKITRPLPTLLAARILKTSAAVTSALLLLTVILYLSGTIYRSAATSGDKEVSALNKRVTQLQEQSRELKRQLAGLTSAGSGNATVGRLLYAVADATPDNAWFQRLEVQKMSDARTYEFRLSGLSVDDKAPAAFAAALMQSDQIEEAHLSRVGKTNDLVRDRFGRTIAGKATEFDLQGRTKIVDSD